MEQLGPPTPLLSSLIGFSVALMVLLGFYLIRGRDERKWLMGVAVAAFLLKAILVPIYFQWLVSIGDYGFAYFDARGHHEEGIKIAEDIELDLPHFTWGWDAYDPGFYRVTAYTYLIFGPNTLVIRFFLIMCVSMSLLYIYRVTKLYFDEQTARVAVLLQAFLPAPILISLNHRKDSFVQAIVMMMFYHMVRWFRRDPGWIGSVFWIVFGLAFVYPFRSGLILPFLGMIVICFVLANRSIAQGMSLTFVTVVGLILLQVAVPDESKINLDTFTTRAEGKFGENVDIAESTSGLTNLLRVTGFMDVYKIPFAAAVYLILPFPPDFSSHPVPVLGGILHLAGVFLLPHMLLGVWSMIRGPNWRIQLPLLVFPMLFLLVLGAVHIGLIRYREIFYPVCLIWAAIGWRIGTSFQFKFLIYGGLAALAVPIYLFRLDFL